MKISKITPSAKEKNRWTVHLDDGAFLRVGLDEMADFSLCAGKELGEEELDALLAASAGRNARKKAVELVSRRSFSRAELIRRLEEKKIAPGDAADAADRLAQLGLLDDAAYARDLARRYAAKGCGIYKIKSELAARGVSKEHWEGALEECGDPREAIDSFLRRSLGEGETDRRQLKRAADALARRGFSWSEIGDGLRRYGAHAGDEP